MMFTKTSQKFGQWSDIRANTVYGLGFGSEAELNKFIEKFQEIKEATRSAATNHKPHTANGSISTSIYASSNSCPNDKGDDLQALDLTPGSGVFGKNSLSHQRSHSLSHLQASKVRPLPCPVCHSSDRYSPQAMTQSPSSTLQRDRTGSSVIFPSSSTEAQLRYENDRLKLALAQSSANAKKWEIELLTLKNNNTRLTNALQESTANVEEWKRQLQALKDENHKLKQTVRHSGTRTVPPVTLSLVSLGPGARSSCREPRSTQ